MFFDVHVHVAELHRHQPTDRFLSHDANWYVRMFRRELGVTADLLARTDSNELIRQRLRSWASGSAIDRFVLLAMDGVYEPSGQANLSASRWIVENDFVADLAKSHPALLFGASVHPYRTDALEELKRLTARGACLVKWIPSAQRIRLDDPRCASFYDLLAEAGLPLLVHTGNEHASSSSLNDWNDPALLRHPLNRGVKVIAAHCGARVFLHERCYFQAFCDLAGEYEHLYGDLAAFGIPTRIRALRHLQRNPHLMSRIVYGSDFPTVTMARWFVLSIGMRAVREILHEANPLERPYLLMRKMDVPEDVFTRAGGILKLAPGQRGDA